MTARPMSNHHQVIVWFFIGVLAGLIVLAVATRMAGAGNNETFSEIAQTKLTSIGMTMMLERPKKIIETQASRAE